MRNIFLSILIIACLGLISGYLINKHIERGFVCPHMGTHYSYFSTKTFFDQAYEHAGIKLGVQNERGDKHVRGIIVNHHLLAPHLIAETIATIATDEPVTVVLISPNHFGAGRGQITSSLYSWSTPYGILENDCEVIDALQENGILHIEEKPFEKEHGISGIVSFIKKSLPQARIIPVIVKDTASPREIDVFVEALYENLGENALIIGSFDFSHGATNDTAIAFDQKSIAAITAFDYEGIKTIETDSRPGLSAVMKYMEKVGAKKFTVLFNTNAAQILKDLNLKDVTSYIDGKFSK